jgi:hypothetical protein
VIIFTRHALERMKQRDISRDDVIKALQDTENRTTDPMGHQISTIETDDRILRVFFVERDKDVVVITAYRTSKRKYRIK